MTHELLGKVQEQVDLSHTFVKMDSFLIGGTGIC